MVRHGRTSVAEFGSHEVTIVTWSSVPAEAVYASGDVLYLVVSMGVFEPDYSEGIGGIIARLP